MLSGAARHFDSASRARYGSLRIGFCKHRRNTRLEGSESSDTTRSLIVCDKAGPALRAPSRESINQSDIFPPPLPPSLFLSHSLFCALSPIAHHLQVIDDAQPIEDMSQLSRTALRSLRVSSSSSSTTAAKKTTSRTTRWAWTDDGPPKNFKGQLLESISQRLEREKAELRWANQMRASKDRAWMWAPTIGRH